VHLAAEAMGLATSVLLLALGFRRHRMQARAPHRAAGQPAALLRGATACGSARRARARAVT
jgi:hypothetical protein